MQLTDRAIRLYRFLCDTIKPSAEAWRFSVGAILLSWLLLLMPVAWPVLIVDFTIWKVIGFLTFYFALVAASTLGYWLIRLAMQLPKKFVFALIISLPILLLLTLEFGQITGMALGAGGLLCLIFIGGGVGTLVTRGLHPRTQKFTLGLMTLAVIGMGSILYLSFVRYIDPNPALSEYQLVNRTLSLPDPSLPGEFAVLFTSYGSGTDGHRAEFGDAAGLKTQSVDGSKLIDNWENVIGWSRTRFWGFGPAELPVQARVWYPAGAGSFPLVLIVHGNHPMEDFSDPGYEYLGSLLASRGYLVASVDENFLNLSIGDLINPIDNGLEEENDARGWLLLEHLRQWREWSQSPGHLFYNRVDMRNISLIGHSRGGEAVAIASYFNRLSHYPDDGSVIFDFDFDLKGIIAIAPVDGQYRPRSFSTPMEDTNYFVIHGSDDGDVTSFAGIRQFNRATLNNSDQFKAALYIAGANHGQFNSGWGNQDTMLGWSLRRASLMPERDQRRIAQVYFSAFLDITHRRRREYLPIFENVSYAANWLPETFYVNNYQKLFTRWLANFEEDGDLNTGTMDNLSIQTHAVSKWSEAWQGLKYGVLNSHVLAIAWDERFADEAELSLDLGSPINLGNYRALIFTAAQNTGSTLPDDFDLDTVEEEGDSEEGDEEEYQLLNWSIVLEDVDGNSARQVLSQAELLYPQVRSNTLRAQYGYSGARSEAIMKYYSFPLDEFVEDSEDFSINRVVKIRFLFDQSERGTILVDDIGLI